MKFFAFCLSLVTVSPLLRAQETPLPSFIETTLRQYQVPGAVVVIVEEGKQPSVQGFGVSDLETGRKVDGDTRFQLASVTKTFTGALFGIGMDKGELSFDKPVKEVFPPFRLHDEYATKWATVVDLLSHRSGLPAFAGGLLEFVGFNKEQIIRKAAFIAPATSFRDRAAYSNIGYFLAGEATAQAGHQPWFTLLKARLLLPLQMTNTGLAGELMPGGGNVAKPYAKTPQGSVAPTPANYQPVLVPAGGLASTGNDMARYLQMWLDKGRYANTPVISAESVEKLFTPVIAEEPGFAELPPISESSGFSYTAGGWGEYHYGNHRILEKGGALEGYRTVVVLVPEKKWGVAILCNLNLTVFPEAVRAELLERLLGRSGHDFQATIRERQKMIDGLVLPPEPPKHPARPTGSAEAYAGTYSNELYGEWTIASEGDGQKGAWTLEAGPGKFKGKLVHWNKDEFRVFWPLANAGNASLKFKIHQTHQTHQPQKAVEFIFDDEHLFRRIGR